MAEEQYYTISQVAEMLNEFPGLTVSSLRFLEKEELVTPERTAGGHRRYTLAQLYIHPLLFQVPADRLGHFSVKHWHQLFELLD